jgi:ABC-2 type transport system permease protein
VTRSALTLARTFLKIFVRDRQAMFFSLFFPLVFMVAFGFIGSQEPEPVRIGIVNHSSGSLADDFIAILDANPLFVVEKGSEEQLRAELAEGDRKLVLVIPPEFGSGNGTADFTVLVDAAEARQASMIVPMLEQELVGVERELRDIEPMFNLQVVDVQSRSRRYIDFLVPGLLGFSLLQLSIAGSGYNIVEFRRKGILKRLFVTPLRPRDFILGLVMSRTLICVVQIGILLAIAVFYLDVPVSGDPVSLLMAILFGTAVFLSLGFCVGSLAKSQPSVMAIGNLVVFPQIFFAGVFFPMSSMPDLIQPLAQVLPLTFVVDALREIIVDGVPLTALLGDVIGMAVWLVIGLFLAVRLFSWKDIAG